MAGIKINDHKSWIIARWVFHDLADRVGARREENSPVRSAFDFAVKSGLLWFSIEGWKPEEQRDLAKVVGEIYEELTKADVNQFATREGYDGLKARVSELVEMLSSIGSATP